MKGLCKWKRFHYMFQNSCKKGVLIMSPKRTNIWRVRHAICPYLVIIKCKHVMDTTYIAHVYITEMWDWKTLKIMCTAIAKVGGRTRKRKKEILKREVNTGAWFWARIGLRNRILTRRWFGLTLPSPEKYCPNLVGYNVCNGAQDGRMSMWRK